MSTLSTLTRRKRINRFGKTTDLGRLGTSILIFCLVLGLFIPFLEIPQTANAQTSEIIVNGGFETADLTGWTISGSGGIAESEAHSGSYCVWLGGMTLLTQEFEPPEYPSGNLTFWAKTYLGGIYSHLWAIIVYNDGTNDTYSLALPDPFGAWTPYEVKVNVTKLLNGVQILTYEQSEAYPMLFDDFSVRASWTIPSYVRDIYGHFRLIEDMQSISANVEMERNIADLQIFAGFHLIVLGRLEDATRDGWVLLEVQTASGTLHYELQIKAHSRGDSWPMHGRDPTHAGFSVSTAPTNNSTRWNYTTGSAIEYSPAIADGMAFLGSSSDMRALNVTTGSLLWTFTRNVTSSPSVAGGVVFFGASDGLYAINETSGLPVWRYQTSAPVYSSPIVCFGRVIFGCDNNYVYALNQTDKSVIWSFLADGPVRTSPGNSPDALADPRPTPLAIFGTATTMYAVNMTTGASLWSYACAVRSSPTSADGFVFFGAKNGLYALNATTGAFIWQFLTSAPVQSSPAVGSGRVFFGCNNNMTYALNGTNGNELWNAEADGPVVGAPALAGEIVIYPYSWTKGEIRSQSTGELQWSFLASAPILASASLAYGNLFLGDTNGNLYCIGPQNDVATNAVVTSKTVVGKGYSVSINVTAQNKGEVTETFYVSALHGGMIDELPITLSPDSADMISIRWNTANTDMGNYTIGGYSEAVPGETSTSDNLLTGGWVVVTIPGDVKGDFIVDIFDAIMLAGTFNSVPQSPGWNPNTDINDDSSVDIYDAIILAGHFNQQYP